MGLLYFPKLYLAKIPFIYNENNDIPITYYALKKAISRIIVNILKS